MMSLLSPCAHTAGDVLDGITSATVLKTIGFLSEL
jgi:hypothetical protein